MNLTVKRIWFTEKTTIGELYVDGARECFTLEDRYRAPPEPKVFGETAIPEGRYEVIINHSPHFGCDMPRLVDVPGYAGVLIHSGNVAADTEGCLLVGQSHGVDRIDLSRAAFASLFPKLKAAIARGERIFLQIGR